MLYLNNSISCVDHCPILMVIPIKNSNKKEKWLTWELSPKTLAYSLRDQFELYFTR